MIHRANGAAKADAREGQSPMKRNGLLVGVLVLTVVAPAMLWTVYYLSTPPTAIASNDEEEEEAEVETTPEDDSDAMNEDTGEAISGHGKAKPKAKAEKEHKPKAEAKPKEDKHKADAKHKPEAKAKHAPKPKPAHKPAVSSATLAKGPTPPPKDELPTLKDLVPIARPVDGLSESTLFPISVPKTFPPASPSSADDAPVGSIADPATTDPNGAEANGEGGIAVRRLLRREGSEVKDLVGSITKRGSNIIFAPSDQSTPLILLPGQLLERVEFYQQVQTRLGRDLPWRISGLITEYRGSNYLLITAATLLEQPPNAQVDPVK